MRLMLIAGLALLAAAPASAVVTTTTYTGVVYDAQGNIGASSMFGAIQAGTSAYTLTYTIDDGLPGAVLVTEPTHTSISGGGSVKAALTINGVTLSINGSSLSSAENYSGRSVSNGLPIDSMNETSQDFSYQTGGLYYDAYAQTFLSSYLNDFTDGDFRSPVSYTPVSGDSYLNSAHLNIFDFGTNTQIANVYLLLAPGTVATSTSAVPEAATWATTIGGFGLVGGAMRRRRTGIRFA